MKKRFSIISGLAIAALSLGVMTPAIAAPAHVTLSLFHNNDGESALYDQDLNGLEVGNAGAFVQVLRAQMRDARAKGNSVLNVYAGDSFLASKTMLCAEPGDPDSTATIHDAVAQSLMPYDVYVFGNHEFDFGTRFLDRYIGQFAKSKTRPTPFISGNLDFSKNIDLRDNFGGAILERGKIAANKTVGRVYIHTDSITKERFGVIAATTPLLPTISSPGTVKITTRDLAETATLLQAQIRELERRGINKIVLVSHLQDFNNDKTLISMLTGVDVAVAGGGDDLLVNPKVPKEVQLLPGEVEPVGDYPTLVTDKAGKIVPLVTSEGKYKYVGRIDIKFDARGNYVSHDEEISRPYRVIPKSAEATAAGITDAVTPDSRIVAQAINPVKACTGALSTTVVSNTEVVLLNARGSATGLGVRTGETNAGNMVADGFLYAYNQQAAAYGLTPASATNRVVAISNGGGIRQNGGNETPNDGKPGAISRAATYDMLPFGNKVSVVPGVTPAILKQVFERSCASGLAGGGQFLQFSGLKVTCKKSGPAIAIGNDGVITAEGERVQSIELTDGTKIVTAGAVVAGAPTVSVVTTNFTAEGGDNYSMLVPLGFTILGLTDEDALVQYLRSFPVNAQGVPTVPASDVRYAKQTGEGRFTWVD
jgi:2',3'-cyclic-nucleotide 2'-phosphodiesterase (5'-nucleotidase family)